MKITKSQMRRIINEEMLAVRLSRQLLKEQNDKILAEHRLLVEKRQDFTSLVLTEILRSQLGSDFDIWKLDEGLWDKLKSKLNKLAVFARSRNLEKGGKLDIAGLFGSNKKLDAARDEMVRGIAKTAKDSMEAFMKKMKEAHPDFPNENSKEEFIAGLEEIAKTYDSLVAGAKKDPTTAEAADAMIRGLRSYLKFILDNKLGDVGKHFVREQDEEEEADGSYAAGPALVPAEEDEPSGAENLPKEKTVVPTDQRKANPTLVPPEASDIQDMETVVPSDGSRKAEEDSALDRVMAGEGSAELDSETIKGLKSNFAPKALGLTGVAAGMMSMLLMSSWFQGLLSQLASGGSGAAGATNTITATLSPKPGEGFTQMLGRLSQGNPNAFGPNTKPEVLFKAMKKLGIKDPRNPAELFALGVDPGAYASAIASGATDLGTMFPASNKNLWLDLGKSVTTQITNQIKKKAGSGALAGAAASLAAASPAASAILGPLGIALVASGAAVKLLRMKGMKSSRAQLINDLASKMALLNMDTGALPDEVVNDVVPVVTSDTTVQVSAPEEKPQKQDTKEPEEAETEEPTGADHSKAKNIFYQHGRDNAEQFAKQLHKLERAAKIDKVGLMGIGDDDKVIPLRPLKVKRGKKQLATHPDQLQPKYISAKKATPEQVEYYEEFARGVRDGYITARDNGKDWAQKLKLTEVDEIYEDDLYENQSNMGVETVKEGIAARREKLVLSKWNKIAGIS